LTIACHAGVEFSVAATKTNTAQLTALALLAAFWRKDERMQEEVRALPSAVERTLGMAQPTADHSERHRYIETFVVLGRGCNYATAYEIALKVKGLNYLFIDAYSSADFKHGLIAVIEQGFPAICVAPSGEVYADMVSLLRELADKGAELIAISDRPEALEMAVTPLQLPVTVPEWLSPVVVHRTWTTPGPRSDRGHGLRSRPPSRSAQGHTHALAGTHAGLA